MDRKRKDSVNVFVADTAGPEDYAAFFEDTDGEAETPAGGFLYIQDQRQDQVIRHLEIYRHPLPVKEEDVEILWSADGSKCGISVWGRMRAILNIATEQETRVQLENRESPAITDPSWLSGFDQYLDQHVFIRSRQRHWKKLAKSIDPKAEVTPEQLTPIETNFVLTNRGPDNLFAVFEDEGRSGYLYLYDAAFDTVVEHLLIYDRSDEIAVRPADVRVVWSDDGGKCGVIIWKRMRGIIDRVKKKEGRIKLEHKNTPGIADQQWLQGFEYIFRKPV